jgi:putative transposase
MEQRVDFIRELEKQEESFAELCRKFGISRQTGYKWQDRYQREGTAGLADQSRAPKTPSGMMAEEIRQRILELRDQHPLWGPVKLRAYLMTREPGARWPAASSIGSLLSREGLSHPRKRRRRTPGYNQPLAHADEPNRVWTTDFKGWFLCGNGERCDPLTISDAYSRYLLRCRAVPETDGKQVKRVFEGAFREFGMPVTIRTDNGAPFASPAPAGLSRLSVWWMKLGIQHERIDPGCPQQNGRHERMHLTLQQDTACPPAGTIPRQQEVFIRYEREYNEERPHQAIGNQTPASVYRPSERRYSGRLRPLEYPQQCVFDRRVSANGYISWKKRPVFISEVLSREQIGFCETDDGLYELYFGAVLLGWMDGREAVFVADRGKVRKRYKHVPG